MSKRLFLVLIVVLEFSFGAWGLIAFRNYRQQQAKILGATKIATIDETQVIKNIDQELKYYWEYLPGDEVVDHPYWLGKDVVYRINNDGFNDLYDYPVVKEEKTLRILTLGDSFTYGHYVETKDNWTEVLERALNESLPCEYQKVEVINLGMPGFDVQELVRRYERLGQKYQPDLILWFESGSGFFRFNEIMQPLISTCLDGQGATLSATVPSEAEKVSNCWTKSADQTLAMLPFAQRQAFLTTLFDRFFTLAQKSQAVFFYYQDLDEENKQAVAAWQSRYSEALFSFSIPNQDPKSKYRLVDGHPSQLGHQQIAQAIQAYLDQKQFFCPAN